MKKEALSQLKRKHRTDWVLLVENRLAEFGTVEKAVSRRIQAVYSLYNADDRLEELDVIEKGKVVAKLVRSGDVICLIIKKRKRWVEVSDIPLHAIKFSEN